MSEQDPIRVMIVDDHLMVRDGLKVFLSVYNDIIVVAEAEDGEGALELCGLAKPDVILMDIVMPGMDGSAATEHIRKKYPQVQVIALTSFVDQDLVQRALQAGAISYMLKDVHADKLANAVREAYQGRGTIDSNAAQALVEARNGAQASDYNLTPREEEILGLIVDGLTNKEIAQHLTISLGTARFHVSNILSKLGVGNRTEAVSLALQKGLVERG